ncbi:MAG: hypothetical protein H0W64_07280 [Gammaproteobacteria bacterium]|nr:hypothetical protein [Gammaproteobacteria bacterium]
MNFKVTVKGLTDFNAREIGAFKIISDARLFIESKLAEDATMKTSLIYSIMEYGEALETFEPRNQTAQASNEKRSSEGGQSRGASAGPSPFATAPTPTGTPKKWWPTEDDTEKGKS